MSAIVLGVPKIRRSAFLPRADIPLSPSPGHPKALTVVPRADIRFYSPRQKFVDPIVSKAVINSETNNYVRDRNDPDSGKAYRCTICYSPDQAIGAQADAKNDAEDDAP